MQASPSSLSSKKAPRRCQPVTQRSRASYHKQTTGHFKQTRIRSCNFQTSSRRLSDQTLSSSQRLQVALALWEWQYLWSKDSRVHMKWRNPSTQIYTLYKERGWQHLAVPSRNGLSGFSITIIELHMHSRQKHSDAVKALGQATYRILYTIVYQVKHNCGSFYLIVNVVCIFRMSS